MNGNFKYKMTDEQRSKMRDRLTGKKSKALATRAEIANFLQGCLDKMLAGHEPVAAEPTAAAPVFDEPAIEQTAFNLSDYSDADVEDLVKQNALLITRINRLQHRLDLECAS